MDKNLLLNASFHKGIGLKTLNRIRDYLMFNSACSLKSIFDSINNILNNKVIQYDVNSLLQAESDANKAIELSIRKNIKIITTLKNYPIVYGKGDLTLLNKKIKVGIVGTRKPFDYIEELTEIVSSELSSLDITIVSGLAKGIDTQAHIGALKEKGSTIAVLPSGILSIYPAENIKLANQIAEEGLLISLFPPDFIIKKYSAVLRNSLLSDLSDILIVSQSTLKGGSSYAANRFISQKKPVLAFPFKGNEFTLNEKIITSNTKTLF